MKSKQQLPNRRLPGLVLVAVFAIVLSGHFQRVNAQWATNGNNISNTNTGNVGVGTASPGFALDAQQNSSNNSTGTVLRLKGNSAGTNNNTQIRFTGKTNGDLFTIGTDITTNNGTRNFQVYDLIAGTARVTIDSSGKVGIGTTTPGHSLDVIGEIYTNTGIRFPNNTLQTIALSYGSSANTAVEGNKQITITTDGSSGLAGGTSVTLGSGGSFTLTNNDKGSSQSIFKNVANAGGTVQFSATSNPDTIRFAGSGGASVSFDNLTKKITIDASSITSSQWTTSSSNINYAVGGNVGIGTPSPASKLDVTGNGHFSGNLTVDGNIAAKYQDIAEWVPASEQLPAGTVVVLDSTRSNQVISSTQAYDTRVAGVISAQPGIALGESGANKVLVATTGRVMVKVDASNGPIHIGDLLVTSDVPGVAMKSEPVNLSGVQLHRPGTLIGKALEPLAKGQREILVLLSLQ